MPTKRRRPAETLTSATLRTLIGSTFLHRIENADDPPLRIGSQTWTTHQLAVRVGVVHTKAARLLTVAAASIDARNVADLYKRSSPYTFAGLKGLGETTMYVLWRVFESEGLDVDAWATAGARDEALVSFHSLKSREQKAEARTVREERKRTRAAARTAHESGVAAELTRKTKG